MRKLLGILTLFVFGLQAWATEHTVTYRITETHDIYGYPFTFVKSGTGFNYSTGTKTAYVSNISSTTGFDVQLDDGIVLQLSMTKGPLAMQSSSSDYTGIILNYSGNLNAHLNLSSYHFYVTHVKMANLSGTALIGDANPWTMFNQSLDIDVDMVTENEPNTLYQYRNFDAKIPYSETFAQLTITYSDTPRPYSLSYVNAVNGENGVTNPNPTTYNVTTATFDITEPTRTGYTLDGITYTDAEHSSATAVTLPQTVTQGDAVTRKAITYNFIWVAHTYSVQFNKNADNATGTMENQDFTYDEAQALTANVFERTGYTFASWNTQADGNGTSYTDQQSVSNLTPEDGAIIDLYAQWTASQYTVTLDQQIGSGGTTSVTATFGAAMPDITVPTRTGYTFGGYYTETNGGGTQYYNADGTSAHNWDIAEATTLYAQWSITNWTGSGTSEQDPYLIIYATQLVKLANDVNDGIKYYGKFFKLGNDIDMDGIAFEGIGNDSGSNAFHGNFNGDNKIISNVTIDRPTKDYVGFFGKPDYGTIKNLILDGANITGRFYVGVLAGKCNRNIQNCLVLNSSVTTNTGTNDIGIIYGVESYFTSITNNHYRDCSVTRGGNTYTTNIGTNHGDVDGARSVHTLTLPEHVTATSVDTCTYNRVPYYASNVSVTLTPEMCYVLSDVTVNGTPATDNGDGTWSFIMPADDATVSATINSYFITVNEGTDVNYYVPFSSFYCNDGARSQFIIPAEDLTAMRWGAIGKMTFFSNTASASWENIMYDVYFAEVDFTTFEFNDLISTSTITQDFNGKRVYHGEVSISDNKMEITLSSPYPYSGGNLLVYFDEFRYAYYHGLEEMTWYGKTQTAATSVFKIEYQDGWRQQFLPKITFGYIPAPSCVPPTALTVGEVTNHTAAISWAATNGETNWHVYYSTAPTAPADDIDLSQVIDVETTPTYTFTGLDASTKYYFWVRSNCGNDDYSSWVGTCFTTSTKAFITAGDWANASNWDPEGVPTIDDNVVIRANATIGGGCVARAHQITFEGNPTPTLTIADGGKLVCNNPANVTVQKAIEAYSDETGQGNTDGWYFIASPVTEAYTPAGSMLANTYDLFRLNPANTMWENFKNNQHDDFTTLDNGRGYLYANNEDVTLSFTGNTKPYDNSYGVPVSAGFNLVGNPYTFDAYVNVVYYRMKSGRKSVEFVNENFPIAPGESVVIEADAPGYLIFTNTEQPWQASTGNNGSLNIALTQTTTRGASTDLDKAMITFKEGMQLGKFYFGEQNANIYIPQDGSDYAIAYSDRNGDMPLYFKANETGTYTITFSGDDMTGIKLIDKFENVTVDLSVENEYSFIGSSADRRDRFVLVFPSTGSETETFAYQSGNDIIVEGEGELQVFDVMGRMVATQHINGVQTIAAPQTGVYILKLNGKAQKIVVR